MSSQDDWDKVTVLRKNKTKPTTAAGINKAIRKGEVEVVKKPDGGVNKKRTAVPNAVKLENETTDFKHVHVSHELKMAIQKARTAKSWNRKQLAQAIGVKETVIADYENGKAIPQNDMIQKMSRALGTKLPSAPKKEKSV